MTPETRPDPDALLAALQARDARDRRGSLKIYLGMCPGVGKTFAMLRQGQRLRADGRRVAVAVVETHGRAETQALLDGLPCVPRIRSEHRGATLEELDLEAVLALRPDVALVDELAHTNAPGSRHAKRWQDVVELLEAGIDVLTTLNVQHLESRAESVRQVTGVTMRETVPDSLLDLADDVELVDITALGLLRRLEEGKVYLGERAAAARDGFFREAHLHALREIALRVTAERVDRQLRNLRSTTVKATVWRSGERLLVAVGPSPFSTQLVRWTRRLAGAQGAAWVAVHVDDGRVLPADDRARLDRNLALARELGAEVVVQRGRDIAAALVRAALDCNATQIVIGKPRRLRGWDWLPGAGTVDRLLRLGGNIDIYVVPAEADGAAPSRPRVLPARRSGWSEYAAAAGLVAAVTAAGWLVPADDYLVVGILTVLGTVVLSLRAGRGPVLLAGLAGALAWNFCHIPPRWTFTIGRAEDAATFFVCVATALVAGQLTARSRERAADAEAAERRASVLLRLSHALAAARTEDEGIFAALRQLDAHGAGTSALCVADGGVLRPHFAGSSPLDERELAVAAWALRNRRAAGRFTETLPGAAAFHTPLQHGDQVFGVLAVFPAAGAPFGFEERGLVETFAGQLALLLERGQLREARERERLLAASESLHRALLDSVAHELRTPLAVITTAAEGIAAAPASDRQADLAGELRIAVARLNRLVANLLDQSRLESGMLRARPDWCDASDLCNAALESVRAELGERPVVLALAAHLPPFRADFALVERALANLLLNAANHTPDATPVELGASLDAAAGVIAFHVADRGPGLPAGARAALFEPFSRPAGSRPGGLGLGLAIARGFLAAQGGTIEAGDNPGGGARFTIRLPLGSRDAAPAA